MFYTFSVYFSLFPGVGAKCARLHQWAGQLARVFSLFLPQGAATKFLRGGGVRDEPDAALPQHSQGLHPICQRSGAASRNTGCYIYHSNRKLGLVLNPLCRVHISSTVFVWISAHCTLGQTTASCKPGVYLKNWLLPQSDLSQNE